MENLHDLFEHELKDIYDAEWRLADALQAQAAEATDPSIRAAFELHAQQTRGQIDRLRRVFEVWGREPSRGPGCAGIQGILEEREQVRRDGAAPVILDAVSLAGAVKVERYEISAYESLIRLASELGLVDAIEAFSTNLQEEQATLEKVATLLHGGTGREIPRGEPSARAQR